ncbi:MAG: SHOCT domain-containing protein [Lactobacillus sp.]|nr:SHOCT domain-containing protein [Lactobacillus sp.]
MFGLFDNKEKVKRDLIIGGIEPQIFLFRNKNLFIAFDTKNMYFTRAKTKKIFSTNLAQQYFFIHSYESSTSLYSLQYGFLINVMAPDEIEKVKQFVLKHGSSWCDDKEISAKYFDFINKFDVYSNPVQRVFVDNYSNIVGFDNGYMLSNSVKLNFSDISRMSFYKHNNSIGTVNRKVGLEDVDGIHLFNEPEDAGLLLKDLSDEDITKFENEVNTNHGHWVLNKLAVDIARNIDSLTLDSEALQIDIPFYDFIFNTIDDVNHVSFGSDQKCHKYSMKYSFDEYSYAHKNYRIEVKLKNDQLTTKFNFEFEKTANLTFEYYDEKIYKKALVLIKNDFLSTIPKKRKIKIPNELQAARAKMEKNGIDKNKQLEVLIDNQYYLSRPSLNELGLSAYNIMYLLDDNKHIKFANDLHDDTYILYDFRQHENIIDERADYLFYDSGYMPARYFDLKLYNSDNKKVKITLVAQIGSNATPTEKALESVFLTKGYMPSRKSKNSKSIPVKQLRELKSLLDDGIITQEDFDAKKKQLLDL